MTSEVASEVRFELSPVGHLQEGERGAWGYPRGGMGAVSAAIASSARSAGADIRTNSPVKV